MNLFSFDESSTSLRDKVSVDAIKELNLQYVCRVNNVNINCAEDEKFGSQWYYDQIDTSVLYSDHRSWVYVITVNKDIRKIGECGVPLGIKNSKKGTQPLKNTNNRLGRYSYHNEENDTDTVIRYSLYDEIKEGKTVEFYAYKCPIIETDIVLGGINYKLQSCIHKDLEKVFLDHYKHLTGKLPELNIARC